MGLGWGWGGLRRSFDTRSHLLRDAHRRVSATACDVPHTITVDPRDERLDSTRLNAIALRPVAQATSCSDAPRPHRAVQTRHKCVLLTRRDEQNLSIVAQDSPRKAYTRDVVAPSPDRGSCSPNICR